MIGIDRLSISFPLRDVAEDSEWDSVTTQPRSGLSAAGVGVEVEGASVFVGAKVLEFPDGTRRPFGKVELNPARVGDPGGSSLCPVSELRGRLAPVLELVTAKYVTPDTPLDEARVKRLDVARDFGGVGDVPALLAGLANVHRPWSRKNNLYNDGSRNGAQTLMVGSRTGGGVRLYDKHIESGGRVPEGVLRWETEARSWAEQYGGIEMLCDVDAERVSSLAEDRWRWSGMGTEVMTRNEVVARVRASGLPASTQRGFLGWLMETSAGYEASVSKNTGTTYRKLARELGVTLGPDTFAGAVVGRLDWHEGTVVLRAA